MTFRHLKIFLSICDNEYNTTKAAKALCMTQPAVSLALRELEQYYGVKMFDRIGRRLMITEAGQRFREYAGSILGLFDNMEKGMRDWDTQGLLRIGASISVGSQLLPSYVKAFCSQNPETNVKVQIAPSDQLEKKILSNELDFALIEGVAHTPTVVSEKYMEDHLEVICPADGKFCQGQKLTIEEFKQQKFLLREPGSGTREVFEQAIERAGFSVSPIWEAMSTTALVNAVISGLGIAVLPYRMLAGPLERGLVVSVQVEGVDFKRYFNIIYHKEKFLTSSAKKFMDLCRNFEKENEIPRYYGLY